MADDVTLPGDGSVVATDEVDGRHYQLVKLVVGGEGEAALLSANTPQPVQDETTQRLLRQVLQRLLAPAGYNPTTQRTGVSATIETGSLSSVGSVSTVSTVSTVQTLNNISSIGSLQADLLPRAALTSAWADVVRARIT